MTSHKTMVITGATSGIGEATAQLFAEKGVKVYNFDLSQPKESHPLVKTFICNTSNPDEVNSCFDQVMSQENELNFLFVNAGVFALGTIDETDVSDIHRVVDINIKGYLFVLKYGLSIMKKQKNGGDVVLTGSDTSLIGKSEMTLYGCTKAAIVSMAKSTCIDYAKYNIRVNCICPGPVDTPIARRCAQLTAKKESISVEEAWHRVTLGQPIHDFCKPSEVAHLVYFLCSGQTPFMTGSIISIDGGYTAQ